MCCFCGRSLGEVPDGVSAGRLVLGAWVLVLEAEERGVQGTWWGTRSWEL